jgi:ribokinase
MNRIMKKDIVVIGSSNVDYIMKMPRLPGVGETITDAVFMQTFGGKGANQAVGAARAGGTVHFVNCVGDDPASLQMVEHFKNEGISTEFVFREKGISSGTALVMIGEQGANYLSVAPGANYRLTPQHIDKIKGLINDAAIVVLQYEILPDTLKYILDACERHQTKVLWNYAPAREFDRSYLRKVKILAVNEIEAGTLSGINVAGDESVERAAKELMKLGCETVIITLGAHGSYVAAPGTSEWIPALKVEAVDTTAAGDVYCGCLAVALAEGRTLADSARFATAAAVISVTRLGAQPSAPFRKEIDALLEAISKMVSMQKAAVNVMLSGAKHP